MVKTPLRYPGGKTVYKDLLSDVILLNNIKDPTYVEPFAGGAGAAITLLLDNKVSKIVLNDADICIYSFWKSLIEKSDEFIQKLIETPVTIDEWFKQKKIYQEKDNDFLSLGFATFFLNRTNRSGILNAGPIGGMNQTGNYKLDARYNKKALKDKIQNIIKRKNDIHIFNLDAEEFLTKLEEENLFDNIFIYLDPPYYEQGSNLYMNYYDHEGHLALSTFVIEHLKAHWLMSYDASDDIYKMYKNNPKYINSLNYSAQTKRKAEELIITSEILKVPDSLTKIAK